MLPGFRQLLRSTAEKFSKQSEQANVKKRKGHKCMWQTVLATKML